MQGILVQRGTQTAKVVMLADTIELEVLAVEPEARLRIEPEITEARGGLYLVHYFAASNQLRAYLIYIGVFAGPLLEVRGER